ncbi:hypothetical protein Vafri_7596, partial [Volvox africanus]
MHARHGMLWRPFSPPSLLAAKITAANSDARKSQLLAELSGVRMGSAEVLPVYIARVRNLYTDLLQVGHPITEREVCFQLLNGLSKKFSMIVAILTSCGILTLENVSSQLLAFEKRVDAENAREESTTFSGVGQGDGRRAGPSTCGGSNFSAPGRGHGGPLHCWRCGEPG